MGRLPAIERTEHGRTDAFGGCWFAHADFDNEASLQYTVANGRVYDTIWLRDAPDGGLWSNECVGSATRSRASAIVARRYLDRGLRVYERYDSADDLRTVWTNLVAAVGARTRGLERR